MPQVEESPLWPWLRLAFDQAAPEDASAAIHHHRQQRQAQLGLARSYEVLARPGEDLLALMRRVMPAFVLHMDALGLPQRGHPSVFFSVFALDRLWFLECDATHRLHQDLLQQHAAPPALQLAPPKH